MSEFFKAELKDKILQYALDRDDYFEVQFLYDEFLRPNYSLEYVQKLIREIIDHNHELATNFLKNIAFKMTTQILDR